MQAIEREGPAGVSGRAFAFSSEIAQVEPILGPPDRNNDQG